MTKRSDVVASARGCLATPWQHQQRVKGLALDCFGLIRWVAVELEIVKPDFDIKGYTRVPDGSMLRICAQYMQPVSRQLMGPGDVIVFIVEKEPQHMGILADYRHGGLSVVHASSTAGEVVETRLLFTRRMQYVASFRLPGVED